MVEKICAGCGWRGLTWREVRSAYAILTSSGLTPEETKRLMPRCRKCAGILVRVGHRRSVQSVKSVVQSTLSTPIKNQFTNQEAHAREE
jgi:hypothetical protein